jgi:hypothetical protein
MIKITLKLNSILPTREKEFLEKKGIIAELRTILLFNKKID